ncbi:hypothetical protein CQA16_25365, partial [Enterobacter hormaechei]
EKVLLFWLPSPLIKAQLGGRVLEQQLMQTRRATESMKVQCNNLSILRQLFNAEALQRESIAVLAAKSPDQGPTGRARIGATAHANT